MEIFVLITSGFLFGLLHAFEADHIAAVSTFVAEKRDNLPQPLLTRRGVWKIGAVWGAGHTTSLLVIGLLVLGFRITIASSWYEWFEYGVGLMLILLGVQVIRKIRKEKWHIHRHEHGGAEHIHLHSHELDKTHNHGHQSFLVGLIHGLAGSGAVLILVAAKAQSAVVGMGMVLIFGIGSIIGMMLVSMLLGLPFLFTKNLPNWQKGVQLVSGFVSMVVGVLLIT